MADAFVVADFKGRVETYRSGLQTSAQPQMSYLVDRYNERWLTCMLGNYAQHFAKVYGTTSQAHHACGKPETGELVASRSPH